MKHLALVVALAMLAAGPAAADTKIVLESFTGGKTDEDGRRIAPLLEALANRDFRGGYETLGRPFEARVSRPTVAGRGLPADFAQQIEVGHDAWFAGKFEQAAKLLGPLTDAARASPGAFANNQGLRDAVQKGLFALALAQQRMGDPAAMRQTFGELVRAFPRWTPPRAVYGPEAVATFAKVRAELAAKGRGKLIVRSNPDTAIVYIDEKIEGAGVIRRDELIPGEYRVFVQLGRQLSRVHPVIVRPGETTTVAIDVGFDAAVRTSPAWTGLAFAQPADRERAEIPYAAQFGNALGADAVAVVGVDEVRGRPAIVGVLVNRISGTEIRRASVALDPAPQADRLEALAQFLAGENLSPAGIEVLVANGSATGAGTDPVGSPRPPSRPGPERPAAGGGPWSGWKFLSAGGALVALGVGGYLIALDGGCSLDQPAGAPCTDVYNTAVPGFATVGGGVALAAVSVYLFVRAPRTAPSRSAYVAPTGDGGGVVGVVGRF